MITTIFNIALIFHCSCVANELHYITANINSSNDLCSVSPCSTISQFADDVSNYLNESSNTSMIFLPGNHLLNTTISFVNIRRITMTHLQIGNTSNVIVTCQRSGSFNYSFVGNVHISDLEFSNCRHQVNSAKKIVIRGCTFQNSTKTVMQLLNSIVVISTSLFLANSADNTYGPIRNATGKTIGSPITATRSYVMINESKFEKNSATSGGTMFIQLGTKLVIINSTFLNNYAREKGGVLVIEGGSNLSIIGSNISEELNSL